jgi:hypothetical protein
LFQQFRDAVTGRGGRLALWRPSFLLVFARVRDHQVTAEHPAIEQPVPQRRSVVAVVTNLGGRAIGVVRDRNLIESQTDSAAGQKVLQLDIGHALGQFVKEHPVPHGQFFSVRLLRKHGHLVFSFQFLDFVSPVLCRYEQMLVPLADEIGRALYKRRDPLFLHKHYNVAYPVLSVIEDSLDR